MELKPDIEGHEGQGRIFRSANLIPWIIGRRAALLVSLRFGDGDIEVDFSASAGIRIIVVIRVILVLLVRRGGDRSRQTSASSESSVYQGDP